VSASRVKLDAIDLNCVVGGKGNALYPVLSRYCYYYYKVLLPPSNGVSVGFNGTSAQLST